MFPSILAILSAKKRLTWADCRKPPRMGQKSSPFQFHGERVNLPFIGVWRLDVSRVDW